MNQSSQSSRVSVIPVTISTNGFVWSCRTRATIGLKTDGLRTLPSRASAVFESASYLPTTAVGHWDRAIERTNSLVALARSQVLPTRRDIRSGICNLRRRQITAGKCFSFRTLVQHPQKSGRSVFHALFFAPVLSFVPIHHAAEKSMEKALCRPEKIRISSRKIT